MLETIQQDRSQRIGSADIAGIIGVPDSFDSPYSVYCKKVHGYSEPENNAMKWGKRLEDFILHDYEEFDRAGRIVSTQSHCTLSSWRVASATLDGVAMLNGFPIAVEVKTTRDWKWHSVPIPIEYQVQWQLGVAGYSMAHVVAFYKPRFELELFEVQFDPDKFQAVLEAAKTFWLTNVMQRVAPTVDGHNATTEALKRIADKGGSKPIDSVSGAVFALIECRDSIKRLESVESELENKIKAEVGESSIGTIGGVDAVTWKSTKSRRLDPAAIRKEYPEIAERFTVETESRRFVISKAFQKSLEA